MKLLVALLVCLLIHLVASQTDARKVKSFGTAIKNGKLFATEETIFEHTSPNGGVITEIWMTGGYAGFSRTRVRIYVDEEIDSKNASIDYELYLGHGIGWDDDSTWQGNEIVGKNAHGGGVYNTYRIPFSQRVRVTATLAFATDNTFWYILRGLEGLNLVVGDLLLPSNSRLKLYKNLNVTLQPQQLTTLAKSNPSTGGMLFMVTIEAASADLNYLEACFRAYIDGAQQPQFLSSGTEDFFLSAYYYNGGKFATSQSGLTHFDTTKGNTKLSMYKFFWRDPVVFSSGFELRWKNMEDGSCPTKWTGEGQSSHPANTFAGQEKRSIHVAPMTYSSYTWVYEWAK